MKQDHRWYLIRSEWFKIMHFAQQAAYTVPALDEYRAEYFQIHNALNNILTWRRHIEEDKARAMSASIGDIEEAVQ